MGYLPKQKLHNHKKKLVTPLSFEAKHLENVLVYFYFFFFPLKPITSNILGNWNSILKKIIISNYGESLTYFNVL